MRIQNHDLNAPPPIWPTLVKIRRTLGVEPGHMAEMMTLTKREFEKLAENRAEPSARSLLLLCRGLHIAFEHLMTDRFCYRTMARHYCGDKASIPEKYTAGGKSKRRVLSNILEFVEHASDYQRRLELMRYLQVNEAALSDPDGTVNLKCTMDAVGWLGRHSRTGELLKRLGREMMLNPQNAKIHAGVKGCRTVYDLFEALSSPSGLVYQSVERNFTWRISKIETGKRIFLRGYIDKEIVEEVGIDTVSSRGGMLGRVGMISAAPDLLNWGAVPVRVTDCFSGQSDFCEMEIDISQMRRDTTSPTSNMIH